MSCFRVSLGSAGPTSRGGVCPAGSQRFHCVLARGDRRAHCSGRACSFLRTVFHRILLQKHERVRRHAWPWAVGVVQGQGETEALGVPLSQVAAPASGAWEETVPRGPFPSCWEWARRAGLSMLEQGVPSRAELLGPGRGVVSVGFYSAESAVCMAALSPRDPLPAAGHQRDLTSASPRFAGCDGGGQHQVPPCTIVGYLFPGKNTLPWQELPPCTSP